MRVHPIQTDRRTPRGAQHTVPSLLPSWSPEPCWPPGTKFLTNATGKKTHARTTRVCSKPTPLGGNAIIISQVRNGRGAATHRAYFQPGEWADGKETGKAHLSIIYRTGSREKAAADKWTWGDLAGSDRFVVLARPRSQLARSLSPSPPHLLAVSRRRGRRRFQCLHTTHTTRLSS